MKTSIVVTIFAVSLLKVVVAGAEPFNDRGEFYLTPTPVTEAIPERFNTTLYNDRYAEKPPVVTAEPRQNAFQEKNVVYQELLFSSTTPSFGGRAAYRSNCYISRGREFKEKGNPRLVCCCPRMRRLNASSH